ncbi:AraC family transcriptional regulator [Paenibacillus sp. HB172176]|uniref:helix-turn-helix domain-containing protein n=1 Tax=Paenibacillus sp. HB172176 TaxID=2493690 RepID=UPI00143B0832|nr:AraC family transcriptional regulator [Paenibacillus sp. HB172176]
MNDDNESKSFPQAIKDAIQYMEQFYASPIAHRELAGVAGMSPSHFSYMFRKQTGLRPTDYMTDIRIRHAKNLLQQEGMNVRNTALEVGFEDEYYFSRRFKQRLGIAPRDYTRFCRNTGRTVALSYVGQMLAVGITPLGAPQQHLVNRTMDPSKNSIADIGDFYSVDVNAIRHLEPELIITAKELPLLEEINAKLRRIAPVAVYSWDQSDVFGHMRRIAALLNREAEAERWIDGHRRNIRLARQAIKPYVDSQATVCLLRIYNGYIGLWSGRELGHVLYQSLGLKAPSAVAAMMDKQRYFPPVCLQPEDLQRFDSDHLFISLGQDAAALHFYEQLSRNFGWLRLKAVRSGNVHLVSDEIWKFYEPRAIAAQLRDAVRLLSGIDLPYAVDELSI